MVLFVPSCALHHGGAAITAQAKLRKIAQFAIALCFFALAQ
jgi:hypothetical protein